MRKAVLIILLSILCVNFIGSQNLDTEHLRCEYKENPIGIDFKNPRFSWWVSADSIKKNIRQSAYQIQIST